VSGDKNLSFCNSLFQLSQKLGQGDDEYARGKIAKAVDCIKGQSCDYPCYHALEIQSEHQSLSGSIEHAVQQPVQTADTMYMGTAHFFGSSRGKSIVTPQRIVQRYRWGIHHGAKPA